MADVREPPQRLRTELLCAGLVCLGSRDAERQVRSPGCSQQPLMAVGGVAESAVRAAGLACQLSPKMTVSCLGVPRAGGHSQIPGRAWEEPHSRTAVRAEHA